MNSEDMTAIVLDAFLNDDTDMGRFTSQDICDNLRETIHLTPDEVTAHMLTRGYTPIRDGDRLVWTRV